MLSYTGPFDEAVEDFKVADRLAVGLRDRETQRKSVAEAFHLVSVRRVDDPFVMKRFDELLEDPEPSYGLARAIGSGYLLADAQLRIGTAAAQSDIAGSIPTLEEAAALAERTGNLHAFGMALNNAAFQYMLLGDLEKNLECRLRFLETVKRQRSPLGIVWCTSMVAQARFYLGELTEAHELAETALKGARSFERVWHTSHACFVLAQLQAVCDEWDGAGSLLAEGLECANSYHDTQGIHYGTMIAAELALLRGTPDVVVKELEKLTDGRQGAWGEGFIAEAYFKAGNAEAAARIAGKLVEREQLSRSAGLRVQGMIAASRGECEEALERLQEALELARKQRYQLEEGRILLELGRAGSGCGDRNAAADSLAAALRLFLLIGASSYAKRCEQELERLKSLD